MYIPILPAANAFEMPSLASRGIRTSGHRDDDDSTGSYDADVDGDGDSDQDVRDDPNDDYDGPYKHFYDNDKHTDLDRGHYAAWRADDHEGDKHHAYCDDYRQYRHDSEGVPGLLSKPYPESKYCH